MDEKPSLLQCVHTAIVYLGATLILAESSRQFLPWLQARLKFRKQGTMQKLATNHTSVAFLVDGENISSTIAEGALNEAKKLGEVNVKRVYGNCNLFINKWNDASLHLGLEQIHLVKPTTNKNTADIALAVDATELAKDGICNRFCIVTSDSDFTPLVRRLRELKCEVLGIGEKKTPDTLIKACNRFVFADQLIDVTSTSLPPHAPPPPRNPTSRHTPRSLTPAPPSTEPTDGNQPTPSVQQPLVTPAAQPLDKSTPTVITILTDAYRDAVHGRQGEWVLLSRLGLSLRQLYPHFKAIDYAENLSDLIRQYYTIFEFGKRASGHPEMRMKQ
jgi:uncharacterized protein (TIGR00288 family)